VNAAEESLVRAALARLDGFDARAARLEVCAERPGKLTLRAVGGDRSLAVSVPRGKRSDPGRTAEIARVLEAAASAGVAPRPRLVDPASGIIVTDWAPGPVWRREDLRRPDRLRAVAGTLRALHGLAVEVPPFDVTGWVEVYRRAIAAGGAVGEPDARGLDELEDLAREHRETRSTARLGHGDVTAGNLIGVGRPVLVDWEYAGGSDPLFDLATVVALHRLDDGCRSALIEAYESEGGVPVDRRRLARTERLVVLLTWAWARAEILERPGDRRAAAWARLASTEIHGPA
jgi:aminoglycoside phosphotransferase (APT) family kinase protein